MRILLFLCISIAMSFANSPIWDEGRILNIHTWGQEGTLKLGMIFTLLQSTYFAPIFLGILIVIPSVFALHYMVIGPKVFSHDGEKIYTFDLFARLVHWFAAVAWMILVPTGIILIFADFFGGGYFVRFAKNLHGIGTILFSIVIIPMFVIWAKQMIIAFADIKWLMIVGGYLSKQKDPVPAYKFNAGQKTWFWLATLGGFFMIATGALMFFLEYDVLWLRELTGLSQINILRAAAIVHNVIAMASLILFFVHIYMAVFAIKGSLQSMVTGYKEEEEVKILHSLWYKEIKESKKA